MAKSYSQAIRNNEYLDINMPTEMFSAGFSFLDGLQDLILIAAAVGVSFYLIAMYACLVVASQMDDEMD